MMRSSFDSQLRQLNNELIEMGALCEEAITLSAKALAEGSAKIAGGVAPIDNEIDKMERDIETLCLKLLLRQQPVAGDLRPILRLSGVVRFPACRRMIRPDLFRN